MITSLFLLASLSILHAGPADRFEARIRLPHTGAECAFHLTRNHEKLEWHNVPSHWVHFVPSASPGVPAEWETDATVIRVIDEVDQVRMHQTAFTLQPVGLTNTHRHTHGSLLRAMFEEDPTRPFPDLYARAREYYAALPAEDKTLVTEALEVLRTGREGDGLSVRFLIQLRDGRLMPMSSGFKLILPERTAPRGLLVMPYLEAPYHDVLINLSYRAGTEDHHAAVLPVMVE